MSNILVRSIQNPFFLGAYATIANLPKVAEHLPIAKDISLGSVTSAPGKVISHIQSVLDGATLNNAKWLGTKSLEVGSSAFHGTVEVGSSLAKSVWHQTPKGSIETVVKTIKDHRVEIGLAAGIGFTATGVDAIFKRTPFLKNHPYIRLATSVAVTSTGAFFVANALGHKVDVQTLVNLGVQVGMVGVGMKILNPITRVGLRAIGTLCNIGDKTANLFNYGSRPTTLAQDTEEAKSMTLREGNIKLAREIDAQRRAQIQQNEVKHIPIDHAIEVVEKEGLIVSSPLKKSPPRNSELRQRNVEKTSPPKIEDGGEVVIHSNSDSEEGSNDEGKEKTE